MLAASLLIADVDERFRESMYTLRLNLGSNQFGAIKSLHPRSRNLHPKP